MKYILRDYQKDAVQIGIDFFKQKKPKPGLIVAACASGKSLIIANIAKELNENVLILQPSIELLKQNYEKYISYGNVASIYSAGGGSKEIGKVTFATLGSVKNSMELFSEFTCIIIDEAHNYPPSADGMFVKLTQSIGKVKILGLTATPFRLKTYQPFEDLPRRSMLKMLDTTRPKIFSQYLYCIQINTLYDLGFLSPLKYIDLAFNSCKLKNTSSGLDYTDESMVESFIDNNMLNKIKLISEKSSGKRKHGLIFVPTLEIANEIYQNLDSSIIISSKLNKKERELYLSEFTKGKYRWAINVGTLTTGFDFPAIDIIIMARPTNSLALYMQILGRGVRLFADKKDCVIVDLVGNHRKFGDFNNITIENRLGKWGVFNGDQELTNQPSYGN
ncbi:MAG: DEAD/DEAH box helicase [Clostridia bacterium]|jgi:DNA repair protein RadD|nr:DEAD/DEAH box helicase [Clostridia bacterium]